MDVTTTRDVDDEHPYLRARRMIDALLTLVVEKERENAILRATFESRLERIEQARVAPTIEAARPVVERRPLEDDLRSRAHRVTETALCACGRTFERKTTLKKRCDECRSEAVRAGNAQRMRERKRQRIAARNEGVMRQGIVAAIVVAFVAVGLSASVAIAQTGVVNPTKVEFDKSTSHDVVMVDGSPLLTKYVLRITEVGATAPMTEVDLGKPTPDANGHIAITPGVLIGLPVLKTYTATVASVGPTGEAVSNATLPFARYGPPAAATAVKMSK